MNNKAKYQRRLISILLMALLLVGCKEPSEQHMDASSLSASEILGKTDYLAMSYGGYRTKSREDQPTMAQIQEDLRLMHAMGVRVVRTYNMQFDHAPNVVKAIDGLKKEHPEFEMYVMLGTWIDCAQAWTAQPDHTKQNESANQIEIEKAVALAVQYPDIIKIIAVGNEAMVHWAAQYFVAPSVILNWVKHLQNLKENNVLSKDLWITSSDNFASWGGGSAEYHNADLTALIEAVDYISMHTYPFHDTHYNAQYWYNAGLAEHLDSNNKPATLTTLETEKKAIQPFMDAAVALSRAQFNQVQAYVKGLGLDKPIHVGETGWSSSSDGFFGPTGSRAADELKQAMYYEGLMGWCRDQKVSCFFFEAFDEQWKSTANPSDPENHFGLFALDGSAKYALWSEVDQGFFDGLSRDGQPIRKTFGGDINLLLETVLVPESQTTKQP
jgi:exo-beta-1,3-glucanase (GH17 family)